MSNLLSVEKLTMKFGGLVAIDDLSFDAKNNQITSIISTRQLENYLDTFLRNWISVSPLRNSRVISLRAATISPPKGFSSARMASSSC